MIQFKTILFLVATSFSFSQNTEYLELVNRAELFITENDFELALENYYKAFQLSHYPKTIDLVNSLKCSCLLMKKQDDYLLTKLLQKGLTYKGIHVDKVLKKCITKKIKNELIHHSFNSKYRAQINELDSLDQFFRIKTGFKTGFGYSAGIARFFFVFVATNHDF